MAQKLRGVLLVGLVALITRWVEAICTKNTWGSGRGGRVAGGRGLITVEELLSRFQTGISSSLEGGD